MIRFKTTYGIHKCHPNELAPEFYRMTNCWRGNIGGKHVTLYAGVMRHNPAKGVLVLRTLPSDSRRLSGRQCNVATNSGALEIVEVRGDRLCVAMANGGNFWVQVASAAQMAA